ncbi:hypothetical protein HK097_008919 [Rhizophlyctis rosea]|uniref:RRP15-like protein n=1 Tax=Rhizophlyctis rosea TaxID=64517 RepID=A0AAD5SHR2_9FUNG|nr:hypothetical protein HK097_008919 [Rhizophlyctis rosea]
MPPQKRKAPEHGKRDKKKRRHVAPGRDPYISPDEDEEDNIAIRARKALRRSTTDKAPRKEQKSDDRSVAKAGKGILKGATTSDRKAAVGKEGKGQNVNKRSVEAEEGEGEDDEEEEGDDLDMLDEDELDDAEGEEVGEEGVTKGDGTVTVAKTAKLANAIAKILSTDVPTADEQRPILAKEKHLERSIDEAKLDAKARKIIAAEKKKLADVGRVIPTHATTDYEKKLRKVATRGVVKLFNAIRVAQKTAEEVNAEGVQKNTAAAPIIAKSSFLDMLKGGPTNLEEKKPVAAAPEKGGKKGAKKEGGVPWVKDDFATKAPKHWDEEDEE